MRWLKISAAMALAFPAMLGAQRAPRLDVIAPSAQSATEEGPVITSAGLLDDPSMRDLLANGFPARLHYRLERWVQGRWFDDLKAAAEWDVILKYDVLGKRYQLYRIVNDKPASLGEFDRFEDATAAAEAPYRVSIDLPKRGQRTYYNLLLDVETLSLTDLDEVQRWLKGELQPAVRGQKNPGTAVTRGLRTIVLRLLGGEKRHYESRSATFKP
jgi:hypothetical protein